MQRTNFASHVLIIVVSLGAFIASCTNSATRSEPAPLITQTDLQAGLDQLQSRRTDVQGFAIAVQLPDGSIVSAATGEADPDGRLMTHDTPVRIASITKTFVAASILRLWEEGLIDLDVPIRGLISPAHSEILALDGYDVDAITVRHLLLHASGLNDHFAGAAFKGMVMRQPNREWTRTDQLSVMVETTDPLGKPSEMFAYSDTGYILLGEMIERITGDPLGKAVRELTKLDEIGLTDAWWDAEQTQSESVPLRAHQWLGEINTYPIHGSVDAYGGGGIVASVEDTARFFSALFSNQVFEKAETLSLMTEAPGHPDGSPYRIGLFVQKLAGYRAYGHSGFWGTDVFVLPELDVTISGISLNASGIEDLRQWEADLIETYFVAK